MLLSFISTIFCYLVCITILALLACIPFFICHVGFMDTDTRRRRDELYYLLSNSRKK